MTWTLRSRPSWRASGPSRTMTGLQPRAKWTEPARKPRITSGTACSSTQCSSPFSRKRSRYQPSPGPREDASGADRLQFVEAGGRILATTAWSANPDARGFHPWGNADPEGFASMGCIEALLHGHDIALGLGAAPLDPPRGMCERVLARMFPGSPEAAGDPWLMLQVGHRPHQPPRPARHHQLDVA
jgi:hypothetical protein